MAIKTTLEQIEEVQAAITKVMSGQDATWNGRRLRYADLDVLTQRETMLLRRYRIETGSATSGPTATVGVLSRD